MIIVSANLIIYKIGLFLYYMYNLEIYSFYCIFCSSHRANEDYIQEEGNC